MSQCKKISIDGVDYVRADSTSTTPTGNRHVLVVDRGWIFAGDMVRKDGRILLTHALQVFSWSTGGFAKLIESPKEAGADLRRMTRPVDVPNDAEVFCVPVEESWGL